MSDLYTKLTPRLVVADADAEIVFLETVFDASAGMRIRGPDGATLHAEVDLGGLRLSLTESDGETNRDPAQLGGSPTILMWMTDDPDGVEARAKAAGAEVVFPVDDRFYGMRDGRFRDPSGHVWMVTKPLRHLSPEEIEKRAATPDTA